MKRSVYVSYVVFFELFKLGKARHRRGHPSIVPFQMVPFLYLYASLSVLTTPLCFKEICTKLNIYVYSCFNTSYTQDIYFNYSKLMFLIYCYGFLKQRNKNKYKKIHFSSQWLSISQLIYISIEELPPLVSDPLNGYKARRTFWKLKKWCLFLILQKNLLIQVIRFGRKKQAI